MQVEIEVALCLLKTIIVWGEGDDKYSSFSPEITLQTSDTGLYLNIMVSRTQLFGQYRNFFLLLLGIPNFLQKLWIKFYIAIKFIGRPVPFLQVSLQNIDTLIFSSSVTN